MVQPRVLIIGAGSRGHAYAQAIVRSTSAIVAAVAEPVAYKRRNFLRTYIQSEVNDPDNEDKGFEGQVFAHWKDFIVWETERRKREAAGEEVPPGVDAAFVCVLDEDHRDVVVALAPLNLHIMCEKPLATNLRDCIDMYRSIRQAGGDDNKKIFSIGHVLRYNPHNMLLHKLIVEDRAIGDVCSVEHTEPVGWWHFAHSYVRGNWRNADYSSPSLLAKSCHDIDLLLWLLCASGPGGNISVRPHLPSTVSSTGSLQIFRKSRKPKAAGEATNCLGCPLGESGCKYSAKNIYIGPNHKGVESGNTKWPVKIVLPEIEDFATIEERKAAMLEKLAEDYDASSTPAEEVASKTWYGRCVYESDNNVCDDQFVTITWDDEPPGAPSDGSQCFLRHAKSATFHMTANSKKICERYTTIYGTDGEIRADSRIITVENFSKGTTTTHTPKLEDPDSGHGGGDLGLTRQFVNAVRDVMEGRVGVDEAQRRYIGCTPEDVLLSHAMVFAAEDARVQKRVLDWREWWAAQVEARL